MSVFIVNAKAVESVGHAPMCFHCYVISGNAERSSTRDAAGHLLNTAREALAGFRGKRVEEDERGEHAYACS